MRAVTVTQPWASLVACGEKRIETRGWGTRYRGPLAIHAAAGFPGWCRELCAEEPFLSALARHGFAGWRPLPRGVVLCVCELSGCEMVTAATVLPAGLEPEFGDFSLGRWMWKLDGVRPLAAPARAKGMLGLWEWQPPEYDDPYGRATEP